MLGNCFFEFSTYACSAVERALAPSDPSAGLSATESASAQESTQPLPPAELDIMLPKVCEALVLVTQCIITITLGADDVQDQGAESEYNLKTFFNKPRSSDRGLVECLIGALDCPCSTLTDTNYAEFIRTTSLTRFIPSSDKLWKASDKLTRSPRDTNANTAIHR